MAFAENKLDVAQMMEFWSRSVKNIVGKENNVGNHLGCQRLWL